MASWQEIARTKREHTNSLIPKEWRLSKIPTPEEQCDIAGTYLHQFLTPNEIEITETPAEGILARTTTGQWKAEDVARSFAHRAALAHQHVNCLLEIFFNAAIEDAKKLDAYFAEHKKPIGILHGLPVSLKDQFHVKDVDTTIGYVGWLGTFEGKKGTNKERVFESVLVEDLRRMGAVLYCKTSVPHTLMCGETLNNIAGYCENSKNRKLTSGGSSGGEGALISARGSPLGFGTDIGGSVRIPAAFNGIFGLRPSTGRIPYEGVANTMDGQNSILSVIGPLSSTIGGINLSLRAVLSQSPWLNDPLIHEIPWREDLYKKTLDTTRQRGKLSFGVLRHDGICQPQPPVTRAINMVVDILKEGGHNVIDWSPPSHSRAAEIANAAFSYDSATDCLNDFALSGEDHAPQVMLGRRGKPQFNATQIAANNVTKRQYQKEYLDYWNSTAELTGTNEPVDAIITCVAPFPAARPQKFTHYMYTMVFNVLDYPCMVIPVTTADKHVDVVNANFESLNDDDKTTQELYDPELYDGSHVCVQLVGRRLQEEKVVALSEYISERLRETKAATKL